MSPAFPPAPSFFKIFIWYIPRIPRHVGFTVYGLLGVMPRFEFRFSILFPSAGVRLRAEAGTHLPGPPNYKLLQTTTNYYKT